MLDTVVAHMSHLPHSLQSVYILNLQLNLPTPGIWAWFIEPLASEKILVIARRDRNNLVFLFFAVSLCV